MSRCQSLGGCEQHPVCCDPAALNCLLCLRLTEQAGSYGIAPLGYHVFQQPATFSFHHDFQSSQCKFMLARSVLIVIHAPCRVERLAWCCEKYHSPPCVVTCTASPERIFIDFFMQYSEENEVFSRLTAIWHLSLSLSLKVLIFAALWSWKQVCVLRHHINCCSSIQFTYVMILLVENPVCAEVYQSYWNLCESSKPC